MGEITPRDLRFATDVKRLAAGVATHTTLAAMARRRAYRAWAVRQQVYNLRKREILARRGQK